MEGDIFVQLTPYAPSVALQVRNANANANAKKKKKKKM